MTDDRAGPSPESKKSFADPVGLATLGVALSAAVLYSFGLAYRGQFLARFGFDPNQFPISFQEAIFWGAFHGFKPLLISATYLSLCAVVFLFVGPIQKYIPRWPRILTIGICIALLIALVAWILYGLWHNWDKLDLAALIVGTGVLVLVALAWKFPIARVPVVAGGVVVWLWFAWILAQTLNIGFATKYVSEMQEAILKKPCDLAVGYPKLVLEGDGGEQIRPPGVRITCSERFCGFHDGTNAIVVSLEGVKSMRTELPAGCEQKSPAKAAEGG